MYQNKHQSSPVNYKNSKPVIFTLIGAGILFSVISLLAGFGVLLPVIGIALFVAWKKLEAKQLEAKIFAEKNGLDFQTLLKPALTGVDGVIFDEAIRIGDAYFTPWIASGNLQDYDFRLYEYMFASADSSSRSDSVFTVAEFTLDGEGLQFLLVSKTNRSVLNHKSISLHEYDLEGDFGSYFTLYGPKDAENEILRIFNPGNMAYLIDNYKDYNIELTPQHLYVYVTTPTGKILDAQDYQDILHRLTILNSELFKDIERIDFSKEAIVTTELKLPAKGSRITRSISTKTTIIMTTFFIGMAVSVFLLMWIENRIPNGYVQSSQAIVAKRQEIPCRGSSDSCNSYLVTIDYQANGQKYTTKQEAVRQYQVGERLDSVYYNSANPSRVKVKGINSSKYGMSVFIGFFVLFGVMLAWVLLSAHSKKRKSK